MSSYFTLPSFARAKQNKEKLEKSNPSEPLLKDDDEKFLQRIATEKQDAEDVADVTPEKITDDGEVKPATQEDIQKAGVDSDQVALPETALAEKEEDEPQDQKKGADETAPEAVKQDANGAGESITAAPNSDEKSESPAAQSSKKKGKGIDLPSQEEAEKATSFFPEESASAEQGQQTQGDKQTWSSYLQSLAQRTKPDGTKYEPPSETQDSGEKKTWTEYASQYVPSKSALPAMPDVSMPSLPSSWSWSKDKDAQLSPVYNEDGTVNEEATKSKQEAEVSVLLDNMNASTFNNRVFSLSGPMQEYYNRFTQVLKDTLNGAPTAYEDMDKLMKEAGPQLQKQFDSMPPFVQMLVKSLPAKLGTTMVPELLAASSEKPGADASARLAAASKASGSASPALEALDKQSQKQKQKTPGLKKLVNEKGKVATALRNVVTFIQTRFPLLAGTTNVLMSMAVFILMLVFWYCHKRGKEVRLARETEGASSAEKDGSESQEEFDATDDEEAAASALGEKGAEESTTAGADDKEVIAGDENEGADQDTSASQKQDMLEKVDPPEVPLPSDEPESGSGDGKVKAEEK